MKSLLLLLASLLVTVTCSAASTYPTRLDDPAAVYLTAEEFHVHGDGKEDDSAAVQAAIDKLQASKGEGIVFIPQGRYRISRTIYLWPGVRIIGYGAQRPVFVLGENTPGYQDGIAYMFFFAGARPRPQPRRRLAAIRLPSSAHTARSGPAQPHASPTPTPVPSTPRSATSTSRLAPATPGAVAIRFHAAQHAFLSHIDFSIGSGFAGVHEVANEAEDLHFHGGQFGIMARKPSPAWQFTLIDSTFDGQREAAIRENEAGLTLVHDEFRNVPTAVSIDPHYSDQLWIKDSRFENITGPAVVISNDASRMTEINFENIDLQPRAHLREVARERPRIPPSWRIRIRSASFPTASASRIRARRRPSRLATSPHRSPLCRPPHRLR